MGILMKEKKIMKMGMIELIDMMKSDDIENEELLELMKMVVLIRWCGHLD